MILVMLNTIEDESDRAFMINLYEQYNQLIWKTIYKITHDTGSLEDLLQDTYEKLIGKISTIRKLGCHKMTAYVVYTTRSVAINFIKHRDIVRKNAYYGNEADLMEELQDPRGSARGFEEQSINRLDVEGILGTLSTLTEAQKDILFFKYFLDITDDEIAKMMNILPGNVRQYIRRARNAAKLALKKR